MLYLSRLILNPRSHQVRSEIANPYEMHRTLSRGFIGKNLNIDRSQDKSSGVLYRLEVNPRSGIPALLVQSQVKPDWSYLQSPDENYLLEDELLLSEDENLAVKAVDLHLFSGQMLAFRLLANPTVKKSHEGRKHGRREGLLREEDQLAWLKRKLESAGALLLSARLIHDEFVHAVLHRGELTHKMSILSVQFDGLLQVKDPERLLACIRSGIGSGKGLGFGLLSLAPAARWVFEDPIVKTHL
jgi:CRISPR system Cascade subunit CasE